MGNVCGAIALEVDVAGGADDVLVPEVTTDIDFLCDHLQKGFHHGRRSSIIVVAENGESGGAFAIAHQVWKRLRRDYRVCVLGHIQRGGAPSARDRITGASLELWRSTRRRRERAGSWWASSTGRPASSLWSRHSTNADTQTSRSWSSHAASHASSSHKLFTGD